MKPHQCRYWLNNDRVEDPESFDAQVREVCELYGQAPVLQEQGVQGRSTDEKPGIQALERAHPTRAMKPGRVERQELEYIGHGPQTLSANFEVATGPVVAPPGGPTRPEADFVAQIARTLELARQGQGIFVLAHLNIHHAESLVRLVAQQGALHQEVGEKGKRGILKSMASRAAFLQDPRHRLRFVYPPPHLVVKPS